MGPKKFITKGSFTHSLTFFFYLFPFQFNWHHLSDEALISHLHWHLKRKQVSSRYFVHEMVYQLMDFQWSSYSPFTCPVALLSCYLPGNEKPGLCLLLRIVILGPRAFQRHCAQSARFVMQCDIYTPLHCVLSVYANISKAESQILL